MPYKIDVALPLVSFNNGSNENVAIVIHRIRSSDVRAIW